MRFHRPNGGRSGITVGHRLARAATAVLTRIVERFNAAWHNAQSGMSVGLDLFACLFAHLCAMMASPIITSGRAHINAQRPDTDPPFFSSEDADGMPRGWDGSRGLHQKGLRRDTSFGHPDIGGRPLGPSASANGSPRSLPKRRSTKDARAR